MKKLNEKIVKIINVQEPKQVLKYVLPMQGGKKEFCSEPCLTAYRKAVKNNQKNNESAKPTAPPPKPSVAPPKSTVAPPKASPGTPKPALKDEPLEPNEIKNEESPSTKKGSPDQEVKQYLFSFIGLFNVFICI